MPSHVVTLIAGPAGETSLPAIAARIGDALRSPLDWLMPDIACDIVTAGDPAETEAAARAAVGAAPIDVVVQSAAGRRKRLLVADLEATIIENEMLDELAEFVGQRAAVAAITQRAMNGEIDFVGSLTERVALLRGLPVEVLEQASERIRFMPGATRLLATMQANGAHTALVSSGFSVFAVGVGVALGFERIVANRLDIAGGRLQGTIRAPIVTAATKRNTLLALTAEHGLMPEATLAVGDGANDVPMLLAAGLGVAFRAKPAVVAASRWRLDHADLSGLLYVQGYRSGEILDFV